MWIPDAVHESTPGHVHKPRVQGDLGLPPRHPSPSKVYNLIKSSWWSDDDDDDDDDDDEYGGGDGGDGGDALDDDSGGSGGGGEGDNGGGGGGGCQFSSYNKNLMMKLSLNYVLPGFG